MSANDGVALRRMPRCRAQMASSGPAGHALGLGHGGHRDVLMSAERGIEETVGTVPDQLMANRMIAIPSTEKNRWTSESRIGDRLEDRPPRSRRLKTPPSGRAPTEAPTTAGPMIVVTGKKKSIAFGKPVAADDVALGAGLGRDVRTVASPGPSRGGAGDPARSGERRGPVDGGRNRWRMASTKMGPLRRDQRQLNVYMFEKSRRDAREYRHAAAPNFGREGPRSSGLVRAGPTAAARTGALSRGWRRESEQSQDEDRESTRPCWQRPSSRRRMIEFRCRRLDDAEQDCTSVTQRHRGQGELDRDGEALLGGPGRLRRLGDPEVASEGRPGSCRRRDGWSSPWHGVGGTMASVARSPRSDRAGVGRAGEVAERKDKVRMPKRTGMVSQDAAERCREHPDLCLRKTEGGAE